MDEKIKKILELKQNSSLLMEGMFSVELPDSVKLKKILDNDDKLYDLLIKIGQGEYSQIYNISEKTGLINHLNIKHNQTPSYLFNDGVESIDYFDFKYNNKYRLMNIPNVVYYIAFIYNTLKVYNPLFKKLYSFDTSFKQQQLIGLSHSPLLSSDGKFIINLLYDSSDHYDYLENLFITEKNEKITFDRNLIKEMEVEGTNTHMLKTDIESFYQNIYSHTLHQLIDLEPFKSLNNNEGNHNKIEAYFEFLDYYNMKTHNNHTKGILTGPFSSRISSELLLVAVDKMILDYIQDKDITYFRYVDDMIFYSKNSMDVELLQSVVQNILQRFELQINSEKTNLTKEISISKNGNIANIKQNFPYLFNNQVENLKKLEISDLLFMKKYLHNLLKNDENMSEIKSFLTRLNSQLLNGKILLNQNIIEIFMTSFLKIGYLNSPLLSRIYKLIETIVSIYLTSPIGVAGKIGKVLENDTNYINKYYQNTLAQIWHYHLLIQSNAEKNYFDDLKTVYFEISTSIPPLLLSLFIKKHGKYNERAFEYIIEQYNENSISIDNITETISYSKWWHSLGFLKVLGKENDKDLISLFRSKNGNKNYNKLFVLDELKSNDL